MTTELERVLDSEEPWSAEEETMIFAYYKNHPEQELKNAIVLKNMGLIRKFSFHYKNMGIDIEDLQQEAVFGLMIAVDYFDLEKGCKFSTYASNWIQQTMSRYILNHRNNIRIPVYILEIYRKIGTVKKEYQEKYGKEPSVKYLSKALNIEADKISFALEKIETLETTSLNALISGETAKKNTELMDLLSDQYAPNVEDIVLNKLQAEVLSECMSELLDQREYQVLTKRFGLNGEHVHTLEEVGIEFGVTRERIRQIEKIAIKKLAQCRKLRKACRA